MATSQRTADYILEQSAGAGAVSVRKMFGEYAVYLGAKVVGLICDDQLYVKPTGGGLAWLQREGGLDTPALGHPYPGAKLQYVVPGDLWDDAAFLAGLLRATERELPEPRPKKARASKAPKA